MQNKVIRVTVFNEFRHEQFEESVKKIYPEGIHQMLKTSLCRDEFEISTATLDEVEHGLSDERLLATDVLVFWAHCAHDEFSDEIVKKIHQRVLDGMGIIFLHSSHKSKIFRALCGTSSTLRWRVAGEKERVWKVAPAHPITRNIPEYFELAQSEMYGEYFDIPPEAQIIFISWFAGGEVFRSGVTLQRGRGKIFYFSPGHEEYPIYYNQYVLQVIENAIFWAAPEKIEPLLNLHAEMIENI